MKTPIELSDRLAKKLYEAIRSSTSDVSEISKNLNYKQKNVQKVKDHVFYNQHLLDRYEHLGIEPERKCFYLSLKQSLAWMRFKNGVHTERDNTWMFHECAESHYENKYSARYSELHNQAQNHYDGDPWDSAPKADSSIEPNPDSNNDPKDT